MFVAARLKTSVQTIFLALKTPCERKIALALHAMIDAVTAIPEQRNNDNKH